MSKEPKEIAYLRQLNLHLKETCKEVPCPRETYHLVVVRAAENLGFYNAILLEEQLGIWLNVEFTNEEMLLPDEWRDLFKKLAGPYGEIVLKAYQKKRVA